MRALLRIPFIALGMLAIAHLALAQEFPTKVVRLVLPFQTGGSGSLVGHVLADSLSERWGKPVIVDNRPGGGAIIATEFVAHAAADGHTLLMNTGAFVINPSLRPSMPYDAFKDFSPVTLVATSPLVLVVNASSTAKSLRELLDDARANPGKLSYATAGPGTNLHIVGEMLRLAAAVDVVYVPYPGSAPAVTALLGNHVSFAIANHAEVSRHIAGGKLRALAIASPERIEALQGVPTISESGFPDVYSTTWYGIVVPAGTPRNIVARIQSDIAAALKLPAVRDKLAALDLHPVGNTPEEFDAYMRATSARFAKVIRAAGIKAE